MLLGHTCAIDILLLELLPDHEWNTSGGCDGLCVIIDGALQWRL
jgi:hypothetical protein